MGNAPVTDEATPVEKEPNIFDRIASTVDEAVGTPFGRLGNAVALSPRKTMLGSVFVCVLMMMGFMNIKSESRSDKLWIPADSRAQDDADKYDEVIFPARWRWFGHWPTMHHRTPNFPTGRRNPPKRENSNIVPHQTPCSAFAAPPSLPVSSPEQHFPRTGSVAYFIAEAKSSNALTVSGLSDLLTLHLSINSVESTEGDVLKDLCVSSGSEVTLLECYMSNLLGAWNYDSATLSAESDSTALATLNSRYSLSTLDTILGSETFSDDAETSVATAKAIKFTYFLKSDIEVINNRYESIKNEAWELEFLDIVQSYDSSYFNLYAFATRSFSDEFGAAIGGDVVLINIAYYVMIIYLSVNLGSLPCKLVCPNPGSRVLLALSSVAAILLSMGAAFGLCAGMGFMWTPVHSVLPFVILGLGVDDSFVITNAFDQTDRSMAIPSRMRDALAHAATSITVTSVTDFVAFAISTSSALPALSSFCVYAAFTILFLFILQVTFFTAALCLDEERQQNNHVDCCPCCSDSCVSCCTSTPCCSPTPDSVSGKPAVLAAHEQGGISKFLEFKMAPAILSKPGKIAVIAAFGTLLGVNCIFGIPNLEVKKKT